jgi:hypothetical protein
MSCALRVKTCTKQPHSPFIPLRGKAAKRAFPSVDASLFAARSRFARIKNQPAICWFGLLPVTDDMQQLDDFLAWLVADNPFPGIPPHPLTTSALIGQHTMAESAPPGSQQVLTSCAYHCLDDTAPGWRNAVAWIRG